jgi:hypothetical protein
MRLFTHSYPNPRRVVHWIVANRPTIYFLGYAALAGYCLPPPSSADDFQQIRLLGAILSVSLAIFAWGVVHLVEPPYCGRRWVRAKIIVIPLVWLVLVGLLTLFFQHLFGDNEMGFDWMDLEPVK